MIINFLSDMAVQHANGIANGVTNGTFGPFDVSPGDSICIMAALGAVQDTAVLQLNALDGTLANGVGAVIITNATGNAVQTDAVTALNSSNSVIILDVQRPGQRYVTACLTRTTAGAVVNDVWAFTYNQKQRPVTQGAVVLAGNTFLAST